MSNITTVTYEISMLRMRLKEKDKKIEYNSNKINLLENKLSAMEERVGQLEGQLSAFMEAVNKARTTIHLVNNQDS